MPTQTEHNNSAQLPEERYQTTKGPLPKSRYTDQLEIITRLLLADQDFKTSRENKEYFITINNAKYNWTEIIQYANLDHIELNEQDFYLYSQFIQHTRNPPTLDQNDEMRYRKSLYQDYYLNNKPLPDPVISFQEMQAINVYTGELYSEINALLRGKCDIERLANTKVKELIVQSVFCASGLRKIPETTITDVYRYGSSRYTGKQKNEYIKAAKEHGIIQLSGFISSSTNESSSKSQLLEKPTYFHFTNLKGAYIAPISQHPKENEFLMPPSQIQLTSYKRYNLRDCFEGHLVSDLAHVDLNSLEMSPHSPTTVTSPINSPRLPEITPDAEVIQNSKVISQEYKKSIKSIITENEPVRTLNKKI